MKFQIIRLNSSTYQDHEFFIKEKVKLEQIGDIRFFNGLNGVNSKDPIILISNTHTQIEELSEVILKKTVLMIHPNSGYDNISQDFVKKAPFPIIIGNTIRANAVTEYILSALFQHFTKLPKHNHWAKNRTWQRNLVRDQKILILGFGHIGKKLYQSLRPLCKNIICYDPYIEAKQVIKQLTESHIKKTSVILVASNLNKQNRGLINKDFLNLISKDSLIVNAARGKLIHEQSLIEFLAKNPESFAYLDVFEEEPFSPGRFSHLKNINTTSHIAGVHSILNDDIIDFEEAIIQDFKDYYQKDEVQNFKNDYKPFILDTSLARWGEVSGKD
jgi:D-3-phosphoglycerate dehydrogenase